MPEMICPFSSEEAIAHNKEWGFNCGPAALAFAMQWQPELVRGMIPHFEERGYTNQNMMRSALDKIGRRHMLMRLTPHSQYKGIHFGEYLASAWPWLVRVQWTGPWTAGGAPSKWAARQTHWVCVWHERVEGAGVWRVFDINSGIVSALEWFTTVVPKITATYPRADGSYYPATALGLL